MHTDIQQSGASHAASILYRQQYNGCGTVPCSTPGVCFEHGLTSMMSALANRVNPQLLLVNTPATAPASNHLALPASACRCHTSLPPALCLVHPVASWQGPGPAGPRQ